MCLQLTITYKIGIGTSMRRSIHSLVRSRELWHWLTLSFCKVFVKTKIPAAVATWRTNSSAIWVNGIIQSLTSEKEIALFVFFRHHSLEINLYHSLQPQSCSCSILGVESNIATFDFNIAQQLFSDICAQKKQQDSGNHLVAVIGVKTNEFQVHDLCTT